MNILKVSKNWMFNEINIDVDNYKIKNIYDSHIIYRALDIASRFSNSKIYYRKSSSKKGIHIKIFLNDGDCIDVWSLFCYRAYIGDDRNRICLDLVRIADESLNGFNSHYYINKVRNRIMVLFDGKLRKDKDKWKKASDWIDITYLLDEMIKFRYFYESSEYFESGKLSD